MTKTPKYLPFTLGLVAIIVGIFVVRFTMPTLFLMLPSGVILAGPENWSNVFNLDPIWGWNVNALVAYLFWGISAALIVLALFSLRRRKRIGWLFTGLLITLISVGAYGWFKAIDRARNNFQKIDWHAIH